MTSQHFAQQNNCLAPFVQYAVFFFFFLVIFWESHRFLPKYLHFGTKNAILSVKKSVNFFPVFSEKKHLLSAIRRALKLDSSFLYKIKKHVTKA